MKRLLNGLMKVLAPLVFIALPFTEANGQTSGRLVPEKPEADIINTSCIAVPENNTIYVSTQINSTVYASDIYVIGSCKIAKVQAVFNNSSLVGAPIRTESVHQKSSAAIAYDQAYEEASEGCQFMQEWTIDEVEENKSLITELRIDLPAHESLK